MGPPPPRSQHHGVEIFPNFVESGRSWTLTWMFDVKANVRAAAELTQVTGDRPAAQQYGFDPSTTGRSVTLEARYRF